MRALHAIAVVACGAAGCDTRATASDPSRTDQKSREYESCAASAQCQDELRCFDHTCRRMARSMVGDYYAAAGAYARGRGDLEAAIASYAQALAHYDADKLGVPPDIDCAYGGALAAARANKDHAELAARVLHRCVLAVPAGSRLREQALGELAQLGEVGLDPVLLGASKLADRYLTRAPQRPASDKLTISVAPTPVPASKSFPQIPEKLSSAELRPALIACWEAYNATTHRDALIVMIGVRSVVTPSDYEDEPGTVAIKLDPPAPGGGAEAAAEACVRQVVEPAIKSLRISDAFTTKLALTVK
jgi:hypothetical protein